MRLCLAAILFALGLAFHCAGQDFDFAQLASAPGASSPSITYLYEENFEGTNSGYDNTGWSGTGTGTRDPDYSTTGLSLEGTNCLQIACNNIDAYVTKTNASADNIYCYMLLRRNTNTASCYFLSLRNSSTMISFYMSSLGKLTVAGDTAVTTTDGMSDDTTYHVWVSYEKGSVATVGFSSDGVRPTTGNKFASAAATTKTLATTNIRIGSAVNITGLYYVDKFKVSTTQIGDNP